MNEYIAKLLALDTPFAVLLSGSQTESQICEDLEEILGIELLGIGWDAYDDSLELYADSDKEDLGVSDDQHAKILLLGCTKYWINYPDETERYGQGERRKTNSSSWERFNQGRSSRRDLRPIDTFEWQAEPQVWGADSKPCGDDEWYIHNSQGQIAGDVTKDTALYIVKLHNANLNKGLK